MLCRTPIRCRSSCAGSHGDGARIRLTTHGDVAIVARLRPFSCQVLPYLVLSSLQVGLASLHGVQLHSTQLALELILAMASGVLLLRLAAHGNITSRAQYPVLKRLVFAK